MLYTELTKKAMKICFEAHKDQVDKCQMPYVMHPLHLAEQMPDETTAAVALLHDVVEDSDFTLQDLKEAGFPKEVTDAVALLTHDESVPYLEYVAALKENPVAKCVKLADLAHNSDLTRMDHPGENDRIRIQKYRKAMELLEESTDTNKEKEYTPRYDRRKKSWRVDFPDRASEEGDLLYVASEFARTGLYFPYNDSSSGKRGYNGHAHSFEEVLQAVLADPEGFSIDGFEDYYSGQEREMLQAVRNRLLWPACEKGAK